jgi:hypothetical protein
VTVDGRGGTYNPLSTGTPGQWKNKLIEAEAGAADGGFTEPHYRRLGERFLLVCCQVLAELVERCAGCPTGTGQEPGTGAITTRRPIEALPIGSARRVRILPTVRHPESGTVCGARDNATWSSRSRIVSRDGHGDSQRRPSADRNSPLAVP